MSQKINVIFILSKHFKTCLKGQDDKYSFWDLLSFVLFPLAIGYAALKLGFSDKPAAITLIVTVCAIFAGLLLNLLVLVYDQSKRLGEKLSLAKVERKEVESNKSVPDDFNSFKSVVGDSDHIRKVEALERQEMLLRELVVNISYAVIISVVCASVCMISFLIPVGPFSFDWKEYSYCFDIKSALIAISVILLANIVLTLLMIVKRVFKLIDVSF